MTEFTLSIVSHGHATLLTRLMHQLNAQPRLAGVRIVVTLNLSQESFDESAFQRLDVVVVRNDTPRGFGENHNRAFAHCDTPWFAILNPDLMLADGEEPFTGLVAAASRIDHPGVIAPKVVAPDGRQEDAVRANLTPWSLVRRHLMNDRGALMPRTDVSRPGEPFFWVAGMCMLASADAYRRVGGFDERFFLYCEDYDLCARLYDAGFSIAVDPSRTIVHDAQRDSHRSARHLRWHLASLAKVWASPAFWHVTLGISRVQRNI